MIVYAVFKSWHKGEDFITIFSEEENAKKYVELGNENVTPFNGYFYEEILLDEFKEFLQKGIGCFTIYMDQNENILFCKKTSSIPRKIYNIDDPFILKETFENNFLGMSNIVGENIIYYLKHSCNAINEEDAIKKTLEIKKEFDKNKVWGSDQFDEKCANDLTKGN